MAESAARMLVRSVAHDLLPILEAAGEACDRERHIPSNVIDAMRAAGCYRLLVPKELGGEEVDLLTFFEVLELVSRGNGSAGWNMSISAAGPLFVLQQPRATVDLVYKSGPDQSFTGTVISQPRGTAVAVDGGYRTTGYFRFGSGSMEADWFSATCDVVGGDGLDAKNVNVPEFRKIYVPRSMVKITDAWNVMGLRGTGSHDWELRDVFVPEPLALSVSEAGKPSVKGPTFPGTLHRVEWEALGAWKVASVAIGIARRAIDVLVELAKNKVSFRSKLRDRVQTQEAVARAEFAVGSARAYRDQLLAEVWDSAERGEALTSRQRALLDAGAVGAVDACVYAVDSMYAAAGSSAIGDRDVLGRCFRDVHVAATHGRVQSVMYAPAGRTLLK
jgi:alkylation response protein AidB-like acyl-CoA dehydrogenase